MLHIQVWANFPSSQLKLITFVCTNLLPSLTAVSKGRKIPKDENICSVTGAVKENLNCC